MFGGIEVQAYDVFQFLGKLGIPTHLERLQQMRLQTVGMPDATHTGFADADRRGHGTRAPVGGVGRFLAGRHFHHPLDLAGADRPPAPGPGCIFLQAGQAQSQEALAPAGNFLGRQAQLASNFFILFAGGGA